MHKSIRIFLNLLSIAGIIIWSLLVLFGVQYAAGFNWVVSIPAAVVTGLLMGFFLYLARHFSRPKESNDFSINGVIKKWVFFGLYCLVSLISAWWLLHAVAVGTTLKEEVQPQAKVQLEELRTMISSTTGSGAANGSYMEFVESRLDNYRNANPNNRHDPTELDSDLRNLKDLLVKNSGYAQLAAQIKDFGERATYEIDNWNIYIVGSYVDELGKKKPEWEVALTECSRKGNNDDFTSLHAEYVPLTTHNPELAAPLFTTSASNISLTGIIVIIVLQITILLSWIAVSVDTVKAPQGIGENSFITTWKKEA